MKYCNHCKKEYSDDHNFCEVCGKKLVEKKLNPKVKATFALIVVKKTKQLLVFVNLVAQVYKQVVKQKKRKKLRKCLLLIINIKKII